MEYLFSCILYNGEKINNIKIYGNTCQEAQENFRKFLIKKGYYKTKETTCKEVKYKIISRGE